jgi:hypothetical protein
MINFVIYFEKEMNEKKIRSFAFKRNIHSKCFQNQLSQFFGYIYNFYHDFIHDLSDNISLEINKLRKA